MPPAETFTPAALKEYMAQHEVGVRELSLLLGCSLSTVKRWRGAGDGLTSVTSHAIRHVVECES